MIDRPHRASLFVLLAAFVVGGLAAAAAAQPVRPPSRQPPAQASPSTDTQTEVKPEAIQQRIAELQQLNQDDPAVKTELDLLQAALTALQDATTEQQKAAEFEDLARTAPDRLQQIQTEIATPIDQAIPPVPENATLDDLTNLLKTAQTQLEADRKVRSDVEKEFTDRTSRLSAIPDLIAQATQTRDQIVETLKAPPDPNDPPQLAQSRRWNLLARRRALDARLNRLNLESRSYNARTDLLRARRDRAQRQVVIDERSVQQLQEKVDARRAAQAEQTRREADRARRAAANAHPLVKSIIDQTAELAKENEQVTAEIQSTNESDKRVSDLKDKWTTEFNDIKSQEQSIGLNEVLGLRLRSQRVQLPDERNTRNLLNKSERDQRAALTRLYEVEGQKFLDLSEAVAKRLQDSSEPIPPDELDAVRDATREALANQATVRSTLISSYDNYLDALTSLHTDLQSMNNLVHDYRNYIDERVLWIQSAEPIHLGNLKATGRAVGYLLDPGNWLSLARILWLDLRHAWFIYGLVVIAFGASMFTRSRVRNLLNETGKQVSRVTTDRFVHSVSALVLTLLLALPWPVLLWFLSWRLAQNTGMNDFVAATATALGRLAVIVFGLGLVRRLCLPRGLGEAHFRWRESNTKLVRRHLRWFTPTIVTFGFVILLMNNVTSEEYRDSLGRFAFIAAMPLVAFFVQRVFHPDHGVLSLVITQHRDGWIDRLRYIWYPLLVLAPVGFAVAAGFGYVYTALQLNARLDNTVVLVLGFVVLHAMLLRWLQVAQRKLAIEQARKKRAALAKARAEAEAAESARTGDRPAESTPTEALPPLEVREVDVAAVSAQTRSLLRSLVFFAALLGIVAVWADVLPAFGMLRQFTLSQTTEIVDNVPTIVSSITLENVVLAIIVLIVTYVVSQNIPGLLEIAILQRLPLSAGARYAITTLVRYVLVIVGILVGFDQIGIGWSQVQWLAAAITVGLGFGLQEIFANFVSGLIILFERPVRVGDTVTVGETTGTVTRIRIRATTITDWDRKELIIPNKEFVTGQIVNWSLSDAILRVRIPVGIAYGSDTATARRLMLECAQQSDRVLADPAPQALFIGFGDSSLNFEVRVFIPNIDHFLAVRDEMHEAIDQAFRKHGVEISFPQRDLHIRSISPALEIIDRSRAAASVEPATAATSS